MVFPLSSITRQCLTWAAATLLLVAPVTTAQNAPPVARFSAFAVDLHAPGRAATAMVDILVSRWSTDAEHNRLLTTLVEQGPAKLLDVLDRLPPVGRIRTPDSVGYELHYARQTRVGDEERVVLATPRPIGYWEASHMTRLTDYPFTVIELHLRANGDGEGKMSIAAKITADNDNRTIVLENYGIGPVLLQSVKRERE